MERQQISLRSEYDTESENGISLTLSPPVSSTIILSVGNLEMIMRRRWREMDDRESRLRLIDSCHNLLWQYFSFAGFAVCKADSHKNEFGQIGREYIFIDSKK